MRPFPNLLAQRGEGRLPQVVYDVSLCGFALARLWSAPRREAGHALHHALPGPARGRAFEAALHALCDSAGLRLSERAGALTLRGSGTASGLRHESDAVVAAADATVHIEAKCLSSPVSKGELMVFNQKGLDFLLADGLEIRGRPLYRVFLSAGPLSPEARRFALLWGIAAIEPDCLPLPLIHWLAGSMLRLPDGAAASAGRVWREVPHLVAPLQERVRRAAGCVVGGGCGEMISSARMDATMGMQRSFGELCWDAIDRHDPMWLERVLGRGWGRRTAA